MLFVNALSLAPDINNWLADSHDPRILHIFDQVCNLINERGEVLSIVTLQIGNGPFNLVVENRLCFTEHLSLDARVYSSATQINLGDFTIHTSNAKLWNPRPDWEGLHIRREQILDQLLQLPLRNYQFSDSLTSALAINDLPAVLAAAKKLAGLGPGLTPAGDDFIMGALYAAWIIHPVDVASVLAQALANTVTPLTTSLSAAWLRSAGKGDAGGLWHELFGALVSIDPARVQEAMENILAVGETSGADALAGFTGVFMSLTGEAGSKHG